MRQKTVFAFATLFLLGSYNAKAMTDREIEYMNTEGKIEAAMAANRCSTCDSRDAATKKIQDVTQLNIQLLIKDAEKNLKEIRALVDIVGQSMEDSQGLLKFLGETESLAEMALDEMRALAKKTNTHAKIAELAQEVREMNETVRMTFDKIKVAPEERQ